MNDTQFVMRREEPPARTRVVGNSSKIDRQVKRMKASPGEWFKVREGAAGGAYRVYTQRGCLTRTKTVNGKYDIWASWPEDGDTDA